jgi:hypothetical protein
MPVRFPFSFSLSGVNPEVYLVVQLIQLYINLFNIQNISESHLRLFFLAILGVSQVVPFFNNRIKQRMLMHGRVLSFLLGGLSNHPFYFHDQRFSLRLMNMILKRIISQMLKDIPETEFKRSIQVLRSYRDNLQVHPAKIFLGSSCLEHIKKSKYFDLGDKWFFLLSKLSEPVALKHLTPSDNPNVKLAIICREFLRLYKSGNKLFFNLLYCIIPYKHAKKLYFISQRSKYFLEYNKSFRLLKKVFKKKLHPEMSHFDACDKIFDIFFKLMNKSTPATWNFLGKVFAEESSESLQALCEVKFSNLLYSEEHFSFDFDYPFFRQLPCDDSIRMLQRLRRVHSLQIRPELMNKCDKYSSDYHDEGSKSIWARGVYWILMLSSIIQNGDPFLNFVLHSVISGEDTFWLDLFLKGSMKSDDSPTELYNFWIHFSNMQGRYIDTITVSFSEMLFSFLDILEEPQFFRELQNFCSEDFDSQKDFEEKFLHFGQIMKNSPPECIFSKFFYPRVFEVCKYCKAKICYHERLKKIRICEECCNKYHRELLFHDDDYDLDSEPDSDDDD